MKKEDDVFKVDLSRALEILSMPKLARGGRAILKDLGKPNGSNENIQILNGPYGVYVKFGKVNASLPKDIDVVNLTIEDALKFLDEKLKDKNKTSKLSRVKKINKTKTKSKKNKKS